MSDETVESKTKVERLGFFENIKESAKHVGKSVETQGKSVRVEDKISSLLVPVTCIGLTIAVTIGGWARLIVSTLALAALLYYVLSRIGIMRTLSERQAALIWHIVLSVFLLGITFSFVFLEVLNRIR
ncbi:MAG: hypothetical protein WC028_01365 [Candidatus Obscuribacterales bacterium]